MKNLSKKTWFNIVLFGLVGQIAWVVENMYFATMCQDIYAFAERQDLGYVFTTIMVIASAITATATTFFAGAASDRLGKRKPFISWGYILWGISIMAFAFIPMHISSSQYIIIGIIIVLLDCIMTVFGSTSNDAAFNAWITDVTSQSNRGRVNSILSLLPVFAVMVVFIGLGGLYASSVKSFFIILGIIPLASGFAGLFLLEDNSIHGSDISLGNVFYGFRKDVITQNKALYITLFAYSLLATAQQTFFSYLINFLSVTLGFEEGFVIPMAVILLGSAVITGILGVMFDKFGRRSFYIPLTLMVILGTLSFYLVQYSLGALRMAVIYIGGLVMMSGVFASGASLQANFQDLIPTGFEGRFQGVRMCFTVLIPMILGPIIALIIGLNNSDTSAVGFAPTYDIFLAAAVVALFAIIPMISVKNNK